MRVPGIPGAERETVIEPFARLNPNGVSWGPGLKMVRDIARAHDGHAIGAGTSRAGRKVQVPVSFLRTLPRQIEVDQAETHSRSHGLGLIAHRERCRTFRWRDGLTIIVE